MNRLQQILAQTLREADFEFQDLGETSRSSFTNKKKEQLLSQLRKQISFHNKLIIATVVMHFLLFLLAVLLAMYYRNSPPVVLSLLGGSVLGLLVIVRSLLSVARTKAEMDYLLLTLPDMSPEQVITVIKSIYFARKDIRKS